MAAPLASDRRLRISIAGGEDLQSLFDWLRHEDELRGWVHWSRAPVRPGEMGAGLDALMVVLGSGGAGAALAGSVAAWLRQPRRSDLTVTVVVPDSGRQVTLEARRISDPVVLLREVESLLQPERIGND